MDNRPRPCVSHPFIIIKSNFAHEKTTALQKHAKRWKKAYTNTPAVLSAEIHPFIHTKGHQNGDLKTGNVSPRTASVRGAWRNPTFCRVYCDLCPRTIAFLSLQDCIGISPIRRHYNRRFLRCQPLKCEKLRKSADIFGKEKCPESPPCRAFWTRLDFNQIRQDGTSPCACRSPVFGSCHPAMSIRSACRPGRIPSR